MKYKLAMLFLIVALPLVAFSSFAAYNRKDGYLYYLEFSNFRNHAFCQDEIFDHCYLHLSDDGKFLIELVSNSSGELSYSSFLSWGVFSWNKDSLYLVDNVNGYELDFILMDGDNLIAVSGFPFMINCCFTGKRRYSGFFPDSSDFKKSSILEENCNTYFVEEPFHKLNYRSYYWHKYIDYEISVKEDNTYRIAYGGLLLSEGKWETKGNLLIMHDDNLDCRFFAIIGDNELVAYTIDANCIKITLK